MTETIIMCAVLSIIVFCSQAILCLKANQKTIKLIPDTSLLPAMLSVLSYILLIYLMEAAVLPYGRYLLL